MRITEEIEFFFQPRLEQDGDLWSAFCDELRMASCGTTDEEAILNLLRTLQALGRALRKRGILEKTLTDAGLEWREIETEGLRVVA